MYTRWGSDSCPKDNDLVYAGIMSGNHWNHNGGGANFLCMPKVPEYQLPFQPGHQGRLVINAVGYLNTINKKKHGLTVACAVCLAKGKSTTLMIPAKINCPDSWTRQYYGYIMTEQKGGGNNKRFMYECVDEGMTGTGGRFGVGIFHAEILCNYGIPCGKHKYNSFKEVNCVVCAK